MHARPWARLTGGHNRLRLQIFMLSVFASWDAWPRPDAPTFGGAWRQRQLGRMHFICSMLCAICCQQRGTCTSKWSFCKLRWSFNLFSW